MIRREVNLSIYLVYKLHDGLCLSNFNFVLADVGGIDLLICIGIVIVTLVIFLVIMMIRKLSFADKNIYEQSEHEYFS